MAYIYFKIPKLGVLFAEKTNFTRWQSFFVDKYRGKMVILWGFWYFVITGWKELQQDHANNQSISERLE